MSILQAMYTGVSGIAAETEALGVVGDNISNVNTIGFKGERAVFADMLGHFAGELALPGNGVKMIGVDQIFSQGSLSNTGISTDLAITGDGFFCVKGTVEGVSSTFYTRNGQTRINADGYIVNTEGLQVQGYAANSDGTLSTSPSSLKVPTAALPPKATTSLTLGANLDSTETSPVDPWDPTNPSKTSNFSTSVTVYDSLGTAHAVNVYMRKDASNSWEYHAMVDGGEVAGGTPGVATQIGSGQLDFQADGALQAVTVGTPMSADFNGATPGQAMTISFGSPTSTGGTGLDGFTQFAASSNMSAQAQDGYASADLAAVSVDSAGIIRGIYNNGEKLAIGQLAIAKFHSNEGLGRSGHGLWMESRNSGAAILGHAGEGGRGAVSAGSLEQSNVDLAQQFVDMIAHQRAFQANSKTITTADEMIQELVNIKR